MSDQDLRTFSKDEIKEIIKEEIVEHLNIELVYDGDNSIDIYVWYGGNLIHADGVSLYGMQRLGF